MGNVYWVGNTFPHYQTLRAFIATEEGITEQEKKCSYFLVLKSSKSRLVIYKIFRRMRYVTAKSSLEPKTRK